MVLRVGYVREHFASPLLQYAEDDAGKTFTLVECPGGTGQLTKALEDDQVDVVIALTDGLVAGITKGANYRLIGSYVDSPLNWAVVAGLNSKYMKIEDLRGTTFGISRHGSGSELMVKLMALKELWFSDSDKRTVEPLSFKVCNNLDGLKAAVNDGSCSAFMWEWFTTKPLVDNAEARFIGSVPTPWASWLIASHTSPERCPNDALRSFTANLTRYVNKFDSDEAREKEDVDFVMQRFGYDETDVQEWLRTTRYPTDCTKIDPAMLVRTLAILEETGAIVRPAGGFDPEKLTNTAVVRID